MTPSRHAVAYLTVMLLRRQAPRSVAAACLVLADLVAGGALYHRYRVVAERNERNLRNAYGPVSFTLGKVRNDLLCRHLVE